MNTINAKNRQNTQNILYATEVTGVTADDITQFEYSYGFYTLEVFFKMEITADSIVCWYRCPKKAEGNFDFPTGSYKFTLGQNEYKSFVKRVKKADLINWRVKTQMYILDGQSWYVGLLFGDKAKKEIRGFYNPFSEDWLNINNWILKMVNIFCTHENLNDWQPDFGGCLLFDVQTKNK